MPALQPNPKATSPYVSGTGIWITNSTIQTGGRPGAPEIVSRWTVFDPDMPSTLDVGYPLYQFRMVRNYNEGAGDTEPSHIALLHCSTIQKILILPIRLDGDVATSTAWMETYMDLSAPAEVGTAMAAVPVFEPTPLASPIEVVTTIISIPQVADRLGVELFAKDKTGHVAPAAPAISGTDLGFSGSELTDWRWKGFVAERMEDDPDVIRVFAGLEKLEARPGGIGDQSKSANYIFSIRESDGLLVSGATAVDVDIPVIPSQLVSGDPIALKGGRKKTTWVIGRADSEFYNPQLAADKRPASSSMVAGISASGAIGIWSPRDDTWATWERVRQVPTGVSHMPSQHLDVESVMHQEAPRDVGLSYLPIQQQLTPHTIDTDTGQDPVVEVGKKARQTAQ